MMPKSNSINKSNSNKLVLCATTNQLLVAGWRAGKLQHHQVFQNDELGHQAFSELLQQHHETSVYLIADVAEEDYRVESLPHSAGRARSELLARKLNQFYRGLNYRTAQFVEREKDKRKDDHFLFTALNNDDFLENWLAVIKALDARLVGIYLLPMLSQLLAQKLKLTGPNVLMCEKLSSGLRQTYLQNGRLRLSRLISNLPSAPNQLGYFYLVETEKTRLYLMSQRFITRETPLTLALLSQDGTTQEISQAISQEQGVACLDVSLAAYAKQVGLADNLVNEMPELLHMQLLASGVIVDNLAPESLTKSFKFSKIKQGIHVATIIIGFVGLVAAGAVLMQGLEQKSALNQAVAETAIQQKKYEEVARDFPVTPIGANDLRAAVELDQMIAAYPKSPRRMMQVVSAALEQSLDSIQLNRLRWVLSNDGNLKDDDKFIPIAVPNEAQANANAAIHGDPSQLNEVGFITAEIAGFTGNYRAALESVNRLVVNLKADKRVASVEVLQEPVNVSSFADLQGSTADEQSTQRQPAFFKLKVTLKPADAPPENVVGIN